MRSATNHNDRQPASAQDNKGYSCSAIVTRGLESRVRFELTHIARKAIMLPLNINGTYLVDRVGIEPTVP